MTASSLLLTQEPRWLNGRPGLRQRLPAAVQSWLYEPGSLTARLRDCYGGKVGVKVLQQRWRKPLPTERRLLVQLGWRYAVVREVLLHSGGLPLLLARTVIPAATLAAHGELSRLGARPLGEVLFGHADLQRWQMDVAWTTIDRFAPPAVQLAGIDQAIWGRRTVYALNGKAMLVCEWFLPELLRHSA